MKRVLVIHSWGMGDLIMATAMLKSLKKSGFLVDLVVFNKINKDILENNDFLENIFILKSKWELFKFFKKYDFLVSTIGTNINKIKILNFFIRAKRILAKKEEKNIHRIDANLKIVEPILKKVDKTPYIYVKEDESVLKKYLDPNKKNIGFAVGSGKKQKFKRWQGFKDLIKMFEKENLLLFIGPDEKELEEEYKGIKNLKIVKENIKDTIKLISHLDLLVGNDNGLMHIAYALKRNSVTIFGMSDEKKTGGYYPKNKAIFLDMECRPCLDSASDKLGCKDYLCLKDIKAKDVYKLCQQSL